jgi:hypothetical protein
MFVRKMIYRSDDDSGIAPPVPVEPETDKGGTDNEDDLTAKFQARAEQGKRAGKREAWEELSEKTGIASPDELIAAVNEWRDIRKARQTELEQLAEEKQSLDTTVQTQTEQIEQLKRELFTRDRDNAIREKLTEASDVKGAMLFVIAEHGDTLVDEDGNLDEKAIDKAVKQVKEDHPSVFEPDKSRSPGFQSNKTPYRQTPDETAKKALERMDRFGPR